MKKEYTIEYQEGINEVLDIMNSFETMLFLAISLFNQKIRNIRIIENEFLNEKRLIYEKNIN